MNVHIFYRDGSELLINKNTCNKIDPADYVGLDIHYSNYMLVVKYSVAEIINMFKSLPLVEINKINEELLHHW